MVEMVVCSNCGDLYGKTLCSDADILITLSDSESDETLQMHYTMHLCKTCQRTLVLNGIRVKGI